MKAPKLKHSPTSSNICIGPSLSVSIQTPCTTATAHTYPAKILACVACRNSKVKCISDGPEQCKRCLDHGLTCIRPEYQRLKKAKAKLARFQQQANLTGDQQNASHPAADGHQDETDELLPDEPMLPQESTTTLFSNASYGRSSQLLHNLHSVRADVRPDWDPVSAGIMDVETSKVLFDTFMVKLEALLSFFDPRIHTFQYIRNHSSLLFTTMCWLAATVSDFPTAARVMVDLKAHIDNVLLPAIYCQNLRSVEIVQGFLMLAAYLRPTQNPSDDRSWTLLGHAIRVATDLDMHSRVLSTSQSHQPLSASTPASGSHSESTTLREASQSKEAQKQHDILHQRNRERAWMHIWLHEASSSQYTGRVSLLSKDPIVESSRGWHLHPDALHTDVVFVALIELRSQLSQNKELFRLLSSRSAHSSGDQDHKMSQASTAAQADSSWIRHFLDRSHRDLSSWEERWVINPSHSTSYPRPLRLELGTLYICYARMQLLSLPLQWPTLQPSMATRIVSDLHSVSIKYLEDFLDRTSPERLAHSYNSICVTATYAVVIALKLTKLAQAYSFIHSAKIVRLVTCVSDYLRKAGNWTRHQNGSSLSYAKYIDQLLNMESTLQAGQGNAAIPVAGCTSSVDDRTAAGDIHADGLSNGHMQRRSVSIQGGPAQQSVDLCLPPLSDRSTPTDQPTSLQRGCSKNSNPLSSPRAIYSAEPVSETVLHPRVSSSPHPSSTVVPVTTTPSSHFSAPPGLEPTIPVAAGPDSFTFATAPGFEAGHLQWSSLANDPELFAWARSFLNDELDFTMSGASFS